MKRTEYDKQYNELIRQMEVEIDVIRQKYSELLRDLHKQLKDGK